ncbi:hypothetical protein A374_14955 [Fictibacillus macauensis ZFHKF-1]|uniref:Uncharacterized protein n=2 Tax=Fictibacillus TaxID=1329200 RepID=I8AG58_9BACL|nr:hypothetical protein A374_14955 [Fictibacillus macauensis ZFHKF-1]
MHSQKERLSYDRLIARAQFYQEKSLESEKKLVFAEEQIERLELELQEATAQNGVEKERELHEKTAEIVDLQAKIQQLEASVPTGAVVDYKQRIADYEELLKTVQDEINEKEAKLDISLQKIKALEKKLMLQGKNDPITHKVDENNEEIFTKKDYGCLCYFDHSIILKEDQSGIIRGSFIIENTGLIVLENPSICLRFQPSDANVIKGKIYSNELHEVNSDNLENFQWMFVDNDWAKEANERGEIWLCPIRLMRLEPGEKILLQDFQIPFKKEVIGNLLVEAFVFFNKQNYKIKAANHIAINF